MGVNLKLKLARKSYRDVIDDTPTIALFSESSTLQTSISFNGNNALWCLRSAGFI